MSTKPPKEDLWTAVKLCERILRGTDLYHVVIGGDGKDPKKCLGAYLRRVIRKANRV